MSKLPTILLTAAIAFPVGILAAGPLKGHPNMKAAEADLGRAWNHITAAQKANEWDLGGHAEKAKDAIKLAQDEIKAAAETSNVKK